MSILSHESMLLIWMILTMSSMPLGFLMVIIGVPLTIKMTICIAFTAAMVCVMAALVLEEHAGLLGLWGIVGTAALLEVDFYLARTSGLYKLNFLSMKMLPMATWEIVDHALTGLLSTFCVFVVKRYSQSWFDRRDKGIRVPLDPAEATHYTVFGGCFLITVWQMVAVAFVGTGVDFANLLRGLPCGKEYCGIVLLLDFTAILDHFAFAYLMTELFLLMTRYSLHQRTRDPWPAMLLLCKLIAVLIKTCMWPVAGHTNWSTYWTIFPSPLRTLLLFLGAILGRAMLWKSLMLCWEIVRRRSIGEGDGGGAELAERGPVVVVQHHHASPWTRRSMIFVVASFVLYCSLNTSIVPHSAEMVYQIFFAGVATFMAFWWCNELQEIPPHHFDAYKLTIVLALLVRTGYILAEVANEEGSVDRLVMTMHIAYLIWAAVQAKMFWAHKASGHMREFMTAIVSAWGLMMVVIELIHSGHLLHGHVDFVSNLQCATFWTQVEFQAMIFERLVH